MPEDGPAISENKEYTPDVFEEKIKTEPYEKFYESVGTGPMAMMELVDGHPIINHSDSIIGSFTTDQRTPRDTAAGFLNSDNKGYVDKYRRQAAILSEATTECSEVLDLQGNDRPYVEIQSPDVVRGETPNEQEVRVNPPHEFSSFPAIQINSDILEEMDVGQSKAYLRKIIAKTAHKLKYPQSSDQECESFANKYNDYKTSHDTNPENVFDLHKQKIKEAQEA